MKTAIFFCLGLLLFTSFTACSVITANMSFSTNNAKSINQKSLDKWANSVASKKHTCYELDTAFTAYAIKSVGPFAKGREVQDLLQPIQIYAFEGDSIVFYRTNCGFPGLLKTKWNKYNQFDSFLPTQAPASLSPAMAQIRFSDFKTYLKPLPHVSPRPFGNKTVLVFCSHYVFDKRARHLAKNLRKKYKKETANLVFVNQDEQFLLNSIRYLGQCGK
ncbi:MAG: hypothetical protein EAZ57_05420 [Cytophagales bacterium]|nr:MAG: hypothetical protein EAZ67_06160 [Cytophagales bacterium]TAF60985.1 MAG: hypothetical protein EAZ57_05420 [Cytophagales bacterium]